MDVSASFSLSNKVDDVHINGEQQELHVLAVDDNLIDRKIVEKLLKNFSCKGTSKNTFDFLESCFIFHSKNI